MSARDKLAQIISMAIRSQHDGPVMPKVIEAVISAGWAPFHTVYTRDEFDALPAGIAGYEEKWGHIWEKLSDGEGGTYWAMTGDSHMYEDKDIELPFVVLPSRLVPDGRQTMHTTSIPVIPTLEQKRRHFRDGGRAA